MWLNVDCGEHEDEADELFRLADILNIACGGHAGDEDSMTRALHQAKVQCKIVSAHPSYVDREGFGRRSVEVEPSVLADEVERQCAALLRIAEIHQVHITHVKLHGALYHDATRDLSVALAALAGVFSALGPVSIIGAAGGALEGVALSSGAPFLREEFADRRRGPDGELLPRGHPRALIHDPEEARAVVRALHGQVDTFCVHADSPGAALIAHAVREELWSIRQG